MTASVSPRERDLTLGALLVVFLLGALDNTIVATAMPTIVAELQGLSLYTWVTTAYLLASTVMVPIYGKLSDMYGRKPILVFGIVVFLAGSMLCGLSGEFGDLPVLGGGMAQLVIFRAVQGLGGAALFSSAFAIIADLIPARERGRYQGLFGGVFGLASVLGPLVGGFFTDHGTVAFLGHTIEGWRWVFYVNLPLGVLSLFLILRAMPALRTVRQPGRIDYAGAVLIVSAFVPLLLALTWGGTTHPWGSPTVLALLGVAGASLAGFVRVETRVENPILPLELFRRPVFAFGNAAAFIINVAFLGIVMFLPLFMQLVLGISATNSGFTLLPLMAGLILSSTAAGLLVTRFGRYKPIMLAGAAILLIGVYALTRIDLDTTTFGLAWRMVLVGVGLGPAQSLFTLAIQNAVPAHQVGVATSSSQFFRQIGSTLGLAVFGALLTFHLGHDVPRAGAGLPPALLERTFDIGVLQEGGAVDVAGEDAGLAAWTATLHERAAAALAGDGAARAALLGDPHAPASVRTLVEASPAGGPTAAEERALEEALRVHASQLGADLQEAIREGFAVAIRRLFQISLAIIALGCAVILFIPELPLAEGRTSDEDDAAPSAPTPAISGAAHD